MMATHIIFRLAYTGLNIPYTALNARLTDNSDERSTMAGLRMAFGVLAALTIAFFTTPLVTALGHGNVASGFTWAAAVFALLATAIFPLVYLCTREPPETQTDAAPMDLAASWRAVARNRAFWVLVLAACVAFACTTALGKAVLYYFKYYLRDAGARRFALAANAAV